MSKKFLVPIDLNKLEIQNVALQNLATAPSSPVAGQVYFNTTDDKAYCWDGTTWIPWEVGASVTPAAATPLMDGTAAVGTSLKYAREDHKHPSDTSRVPTSRTVNGHALSSNVTVTASDIGVEAGAQVNQNAFSNVKVGGSTISADTTTDTLELEAGSNVTLTPDTANDKVTISATDTTYASGTQAQLEAGTSTTNSVWQPKILHDYIAGEIGDLTSAMVFRGTIGTGGTIQTLPTTGVKVGDTYMVVTAGTYAGQTCEVGDLIIATATTPTWTVAQTNIDGAITNITGTSPVSVTGSGSSRNVSVSYTSVTGKPIGNRSPAFGGTFTISQISQSTTGQITATDRTITIPDTVATQSSSGLMSASDKATLDGLATGATVKAVELAWGSGATKTIADLTVAKLVSYIAVDSNDDVVVIDCNTSSSGTTFSVADANNTPSKLYIKYIGTVSWT